mmetsp:Transcript_5641/g.19005  ORF Transcript_5641/g.19005 Transcript_5641/m.19005 type:complete len:311 (+) Transcript_5641:148-1080(+)
MRGCPAPPTHRHARCTRRHRGATCGAQHRSRLFGAGAGGPAARPAAAAACGLLQLLRLWPAGPLRRRRLAHGVDGDRRGRGSLRGGLVGRGLVRGGRVPDRRRGGSRRPAAVRAGALLAQVASPAARRRARGGGLGRGRGRRVGRHTAARRRERGGGGGGLLRRGVGSGAVVRAGRASAGGGHAGGACGRGVRGARDGPRAVAVGGGFRPRPSGCCAGRGALAARPHAQGARRRGEGGGAGGRQRRREEGGQAAREVADARIARRGAGGGRSRRRPVWRAQVVRDRALHHFGVRRRACSDRAVLHGARAL